MEASAEELSSEKVKAMISGLAKSAAKNRSHRVNILRKEINVAVSELDQDLLEIDNLLQQVNTDDNVEKEIVEVEEDFQEEKGVSQEKVKKCLTKTYDENVHGRKEIEKYNKGVEEKLCNENSSTKNTNCVQKAKDVKAKLRRVENSPRRDADDGEKHEGKALTSMYALLSSNILDQWTLVSLLPQSRGRDMNFKVKLVTGETRDMPGHHLAKAEAPTQDQVSVGSRCIALYKEDEDRGEFYAGVIGETPVKSNSHRVLVLFDDGYVLYVSLADVRLVLQPLVPVWSDVDPGNREFVRTYITRFPHRSLLQLKKGDHVIARYGEEWQQAEVTDLDGPLVEVEFPGVVGCEIIYRGSPRLLPVKEEMELEDKDRDGSQDLVSVCVPNLEKSANKFSGHECSRACLNPSLEVLSGVTVLLVPLYQGWRREVATHRAPDAPAPWSVTYRSPCGRRLRNIEEISVYLRRLKSNLNTEQFAFDPWVHICDEYKPRGNLITLPDISYGKERMPVSAFNSHESSLPPFVRYSTIPLPQPGLTNTTCQDPGFMLGCGCESDCSDHLACSCRQLTLEAVSAGCELEQENMVGYQHGRLPNVVLTGIYECNINCPCSVNCGNRIAQQPLRAKLQVFRTANSGWGIRTLVDLPQGVFVCTYIGKLHGPGDELGLEDTYFADLDLIEVAEEEKEGYESDVESIEENEEVTSKPKYQSTREFFELGQECFIMDGKDVGNLGRYFNHSCNPNLFAQNVFVDSHDLRNPTLAFFTSRFVPAGSELCWDYNYKVGQVPDKRIDCHCGAEICKGRLL